MEHEDKQPGTSPLPPNSNGGVMDVQPPQPSSDAQVTPQSGVNVSAEPVVPPASSVVMPEPVTPQNPPAEPVADPSSTTNKVPETPISDTSETSQPDANNPMAINHPAVPKKKGGAPLIVVIVAVIIALGLSALVITIYFKSKQDTKKSTTNTSQQSATPITPEEIDQAAKETDETLSQIDDTKDFPEGELTDQALGL